MEDIIGSRLCPESLEIAKGTMFLAFYLCLPVRITVYQVTLGPELSFQLGWDPELLSMALTHVWNFFWLQ